MKNKIIFFLAAILLLGCSSSNQMQVAWKTGDYPPMTFKHIGVLAVLKSDEARIDVEEGVVNALRAKGIRATVTWDIFPFANKPDVIKKMNLTGEQLRQAIVQKVTEQQMDGLIIVSLFDSKKEQRYVPGKSVSVGIGISPGVYPAYGYPYYAYFGYAFETMSQPGYFVDASTYFTESNLYDITTEKLIWTGQMSTKMENDLEDEGALFGRTLVRAMFEGKVLARP